MVLEDYLDVTLRRRRNSLPLFKAQLNLLMELVPTERLIGQLKELHDEHPAEQGTDSEPGPYERALFVHRAQQRAIRDIGDGIAWRLFDYDRPLLYVLADRQGAHHIELGGLPTELDHLGDIMEAREGIAVLNDLTHYLKHGDITVRKDAGTFELLEIKKGHKSSGRISRQRTAMERVVSFVDDGEVDTKHGSVRSLALPLKPENYMSRLLELLKLAEAHGAAVLKVADHLMLEAISFLHLKPFEELRPILEAGDRVLDAWESSGDSWTTNDSLDKYTRVRAYAPYSIFPIPLKYRVALSTGSIHVRFNVNLSALMRYFQSVGWDIEKGPERHAESALRAGALEGAGLMTLRRGGFSTQLSGGTFGQLAFELLRPRSVIATLNAMRALGPQVGGGLVFPMLEGESDVWD